MKRKEPKPALERMNSGSGQNTRLHPQILMELKQLALNTGSTVWDEVNSAALAHLKRKKACPADWSLRGDQ